MSSPTENQPPLPVRRPGPQPRGRHRRPDKPTLRPQDPTLLLAVPGPSTPETTEIAEELLLLARAECPGLETRLGYLGGDGPGLKTTLSSLAESTSSGDAGAVVVPLLVAPEPLIDAAIRDAVSDTGATVLIASPLGPHPLIAQAMHVRLSEVGLARADRARGVSIVTAADGIVLATSGGPEALDVAATHSVLLAARLTVMVMPATVEGAPAIADTLPRLREAGVRNPAIASSLITPGPDADRLAAVADQVGCPCADPLGAEPGLGQLLALRYLSTLGADDTRESDHQ